MDKNILHFHGIGFEIKALQKAIKRHVEFSPPTIEENFVLSLKRNFHQKQIFSEIVPKQSENKCRLVFSKVNLFSNGEKNQEIEAVFPERKSVLQDTKINFNLLNQDLIGRTIPVCTNKYLGM